MKNHAKNKFKTTKIIIDFHCISFRALENNTAIPRKTINPMILINKNIWHPPIYLIFQQRVVQKEHMYRYMTLYHG